METQPVMKDKRILLVDDEEKILEILAALLRREGCHITPASSGEQAVALAEEHTFNLVITDMQMPGLSWEPLLEKLRAIQPDTPVILLTAFGTVERCLDLIRQGAYDLIAKPYNEKDLLIRVSRALEKEALSGELRSLRSRMREPDPDLIVGDEQIMGRLLDEVATVAATDFPVLLGGESGTGKEMVARYIHRKSQRSRGPFIAVNCAAVPTELFESEFFGHVRGSFTGAHADRKGLFEAADRGTIFLDEIGEVALENQVKLLRVLQENEVKRVGEQKPRRVDVRILCATNRDLKAAVRQGLFREDLYYRVNVFPVTIPPLRERPGDILPLARHFLTKSRAELRRDVTEISRAAIEKLEAYPWPGNVRQLENAIKQAMVRCAEGRIEASDLVLDEEEAEIALGPAGRPVPGPGGETARSGSMGFGLQGAGAEGTAKGTGRAAETDPAAPAAWTAASDGLTLRDARDRFVKGYLEELLGRVGGNVSRAADLAGKHRSDFYELLNKYQIDLSRYRPIAPGEDGSGTQA